MTQRIIDVDGSPIVMPSAYFPALTAIQNLIDGMESEKTDRSDMWVILAYLQSEAQFHMTFLGKRAKQRTAQEVLEERDQARCDQNVRERNPGS